MPTHQWHSRQPGGGFQDRGSPNSVKGIQAGGGVVVPTIAYTRLPKVRMAGAGKVQIP